MMMAKNNSSGPLMTEESFFLEGNTLMDTFLDNTELPVEGELAVDVYETAKEIVVKAPVAGVAGEEVDLTLTDDMLMIRGERKEEKEVDKNNYVLRECYWGGFSRTVNLPTKGVPDEAKAEFKNGILTIRIPKAETNKLRKIKVNA